MSRHDGEVHLRHMLDYAREAMELASGKTIDDLRRTRLLQLGLIRLVEVIGEVASKVSPEGQSRVPAIPWIDVVGMRHRLIHGYDKIDLNVLWGTIQNDLPRLVAELTKVLGASPR